MLYNKHMILGRALEKNNLQKVQTINTKTLEI